jgi:hypothetical protein
MRYILNTVSKILLVLFFTLCIHSCKSFTGIVKPSIIVSLSSKDIDFSSLSAITISKVGSRSISDSILPLAENKIAFRVSDAHPYEVRAYSKCAGEFMLSAVIRLDSLRTTNKKLRMYILCKHYEDGFVSYGFRAFDGSDFYTLKGQIIWGKPTN